MEALLNIPEAGRKSPLQGATKENLLGFGGGAPMSFLTHAREFRWDAHTGENPLWPWLLRGFPGRAEEGDELLRREGSGALSACVECV